MKTTIGERLARMEAGIDRMKRYTDHWVWLVVVPVFWIGFACHAWLF